MSRVIGKAMILLAVCTIALASFGCGGGRAMTPAAPEPVTTVDWLLPGEAGATARDVFLVAVSRGDYERSTYSVDDRRLWIPRIDSPSPKEWDYWNDEPPLSDIVKIQARPAPGTYESPGNDSRAVYGILDHGIFWIGDDVQPDGEYFGAGYDFLVDHRYRPPLDGGQPDFFFPNAAWRGEALGIEKASGNSVWGPAVLTMTSIGTSPADGPTYDLHLDVAFLNNDGVDRIEIDTAGSDGAFGTDFSAEVGYRIQGNFLGPQAEEASGIFETTDHYGAFGVKR